MHLDGAPAPGVINFGVGQPSQDLLPVDLLREASADFMAAAQPLELNYGERQGDRGFREALAGFLDGIDMTQIEDAAAGAGLLSDRDVGRSGRRRCPADETAVRGAPACQATIPPAGGDETVEVDPASTDVGSSAATTVRSKIAGGKGSFPRKRTSARAGSPSALRTPSRKSLTQ